MFLKRKTELFKCLSDTGVLHMETKKNLQRPASKAEIKLKENPKAAAIKKAPDEVVAKAIREMIQKEKLN